VVPTPGSSHGGTASLVGGLSRRGPPLPVCIGFGCTPSISRRRPPLLASWVLLPGCRPPRHPPWVRDRCVWFVTVPGGCGFTVPGGCGFLSCTGLAASSLLSGAVGGLPPPPWSMLLLLVVGWVPLSLLCYYPALLQLVRSVDPTALSSMERGLWVHGESLARLQLVLTMATPSGAVVLAGGIFRL
jgi:hypothetical protein